MKQKLFISIELAKLMFLSGLLVFFVSLYATDAFGTRNVFLMETSLSPHQVYQNDNSLPHLHRGDLLHLETDYSDSDGEASIRVLNHRGQILGYVPKSSTNIPFALLDQDVHLKAVVRSIDKTKGSFDKVKISIFQVL
ncbi:MAG: HIRAN domain-containing protein [Spirochaetota bacterium]